MPGGGCRTAELTLPVSATTSARPSIRCCWRRPPFGTSISPLVGCACSLPTWRSPTPRRWPCRRRRRQRGGRGGVARGGSATAYSRTFGALVRDADKILPVFLGTMRSVPRHPIAAAGFGIRALTSAQPWRGRFGPTRRAPDCGSGRALDAAAGRATFGRLPTALRDLSPTATGGRSSRAAAPQSSTPWWPSSPSLDGRIETSWHVKNLADLPPAPTVVLDVTPRQLLELGGDRIPPAYARALAAVSLRTRVSARSIGRSTDRSPGRRRSVPADRDRARRRHLRGSRARARRTSTPGATRIALTAWWCNPAWSIPDAPPAADRRCGPTVTSRTAPTST